MQREMKKKKRKIRTMERVCRQICTLYSTITDLLLLFWLAYWIRYQSECRFRVHHVHLIVTNYPPFVMRIWCESFICFLLLLHLLLRRHPISLNELNGIVIRIRFIAATCASATQQTYTMLCTGGGPERLSWNFSENWTVLNMLLQTLIVVRSHRKEFRLFFLSTSLYSSSTIAYGTQNAPFSLIMDHVAVCVCAKRESIWFSDQTHSHCDCSERS